MGKNLVVGNRYILFAKMESVVVLIFYNLH